MDWIRSGRCRICGCTDEAACASGCCWASDDLCSNCVPYLNIPQELRELNRWAAWDGVKKKPIDPHVGGWASRIELGSLGSFKEAMAFANSKGDLGIALLLPDDIFTIDIDRCIVGGKVDALAIEITREMQGYTEISPSGTGIHIICRGELPSNYPKQIGFSSLFGKDNFIAFTGQQIFGEYGLSDDMERKLAWLRGTSPRWRNERRRRWTTCDFLT